MQITLERSLESPGRGHEPALEDFKPAYPNRSKVWHPGRFLGDSRVRRQANHKKNNRACKSRPGDASQIHPHLAGDPSDVVVNSIGMKLKLIQSGIS